MNLLNQINPRIRLFVCGLSLFLISTKSSAQEFLLQSCDDSTPIAFAHIHNETTSKSTISNQDGFFELDFSSSDLIFITHTSYNAVSTTGELLSSMCMNEATLMLGEVVIEANTEHSFLMSALEKTRMKLMLPAKVNAYYKEFVTRDQEYTHFCDADLTYYLQRKKDNLKIAGSLHESRAYELPVQESKDEYLDIDIISPIGYEKTMNYYDPTNIERFLSERAFEDYSYEIRSLKDYFLIKAKATNNGQSVFEGTVVITKSDTTISSVEFMVSEERKEKTKEVNAIVARLKLLQNKGYIVYSKNQKGQIYPSFLRMSFDIKIWNKKSMNQINSFITDISIYEIPSDQSPIPGSARFNKKSIYKQGTSFKTEYWKDKTLISLTEKEKEIIENASKWEVN